MTGSLFDNASLPPSRPADAPSIDAAEPQDAAPDRVLGVDGGRLADRLDHLDGANDAPARKGPLDAAGRSTAARIRDRDGDLVEPGDGIAFRRLHANGQDPLGRRADLIRHAPDGVARRRRHGRRDPHPDGRAPGEAGPDTGFRYFL